MFRCSQANAERAEQLKLQRVVEAERFVEAYRKQLQLEAATRSRYRTPMGPRAVIAPGGAMIAPGGAMIAPG